MTLCADANYSIQYVLPLQSKFRRASVGMALSALLPGLRLTLALETMFCCTPRILAACFKIQNASSALGRYCAGCTLNYDLANPLMAPKAFFLPLLRPMIEKYPQLQSLADQITCPFDDAAMEYYLPMDYTADVMRQQGKLSL